MDEKDLTESHLDKSSRDEIELAEIDPALDRRITRKFDLHLVPWLFGLWLLAFIDRSNIGNARIDGLTEDLHMDGAGDQFNVALAIFYVPYILIDVPSNWFVKVGKALGTRTIAPHAGLWSCIGKQKECQPFRKTISRLGPKSFGRLFPNSGG